MPQNKQAVVDRRFLMAQILTTLRVVLVFLFLASVLNGTPHQLTTFVLVMLSFGLATGLDAIDGFIARRLHRATTFGAFYDQITDRALYVVGTSTLVWLALSEGQVEHSKRLLYITVLFLIRDHIASSLQILGSDLPPNRANISLLSKARSVVCYSVLCAICYALTVPPSFPIIPNRWLYTAEYAAGALTAISIGHYIWVYRAIVADKCRPVPEGTVH